MDYTTTLRNNYKKARIEVNGKFIDIDSDLLEALIASLNVLKAVVGEWGIEQDTVEITNDYK